MDNEMKVCLTFLIIIGIVARKEISSTYNDVRHLIKNRNDRWN